ncbi:ParA family protein [bacterium]|uniref:Cobyrinic acid ac-diamide synthase n=1 Tax=Rubinisphaera brasiliensis (strain ATCC 49424 / DSM 5305 / JCM 21570 / IAM 15109 / NBRC 103401 / IFAM 1448) TaxID=756272 RepID=F0SMX9_RUBBR|nr:MULTISPECIES: AAA family ATPase [Rubinisphaera]ADY59983.1 cobyrinic acid ac-diamide synthase [Rubinisphaera brasiliensis DSM 5305]MBB03704.1 ParA family protein [Planctomyces sp.]MBR9800473.1 ParA family protein [bacterium]
MRIIAIMNQKGGVGKTTSSVNIAAGLAKQGRKVLLLDLDSQGNSSSHLGIEVYPGMNTIYQVFSHEQPLSAVRQLVGQNLWLAPANMDLAAVDVELIDAEGREFILRRALDTAIKSGDAADLDYVIMDCPPALNTVTINALTAATEMFIPVQPHYLSLQGLSRLLETSALIKRRLNRNLAITGLLLCLYETGTRLAADVTDDLMRFLDEADPMAPWANARIFNSRIRRNIRLAEAPSFAQSIFEYAPESAGAHDYNNLVKEILADEVKLQEAPEAPRAAA